MKVYLVRSGSEDELGNVIGVHQTIEKAEAQAEAYANDLSLYGEGGRTGNVFVIEWDTESQENLLKTELPWHSA